MWRVFQRGMERWLADLLQPVFDNLVADRMVPRFVQRLRILEFTIDHEAPYFSNMRRRTSRKAPPKHLTVKLDETCQERLSNSCCKELTIIKASRSRHIDNKIQDRLGASCDRSLWHSTKECL